MPSIRSVWINMNERALSTMKFRSTNSVSISVPSSKYILVRFFTLHCSLTRITSHSSEAGCTDAFLILSESEGLFFGRLYDPNAFLKLLLARSQFFSASHGACAEAYHRQLSGEPANAAPSHGNVLRMSQYHKARARPEFSESYP